MIVYATPLADARDVAALETAIRQQTRCANAVPCHALQTVSWVAFKRACFRALAGSTHAAAASLSAELSVRLDRGGVELRRRLPSCGHGKRPRDVQAEYLR
jgi:hypothetical protein